MIQTDFLQEGVYPLPSKYRQKYIEEKRKRETEIAPQNPFQGIETARPLKKIKHTSIVQEKSRDMTLLQGMAIKEYVEHSLRKMASGEESDDESEECPTDSLYKSLSKEKGEEVADAYLLLKDTLKQEGIGHLKCAQAFVQEVTKSIPGLSLPSELSEQDLSSLPFMDYLDLETEEERKEALNHLLAIKLREENHPETKEKIEGALFLLGALTFIATRDKRLFAQLIKKEPQTVENEAKEAMESILREMGTKIEKRVETNRQTHLFQDETYVFRNASLLAAYALTTKEGRYIPGISEVVLEALFPKNLQDTTPFLLAKHTLSVIDQSKESISLLDSIRLPEQKRALTLLYASTMKPFSAPLCKTDATAAVVSSLIDFFRQSGAGTCFATACFIKILQENPSLALNDLVDIVEKGHLERSSWGEKRKIPFLLMMTHTDLDQILTVSEEGLLLCSESHNKTAMEQEHRLSKPLYLYDVPEIKRALNTFGEDPKSLTLEALRKLPKTFSIEQFLDTATTIVFFRISERRDLRSLEKCSLESMKERAHYHYQEVSEHPLHRAIESILSSSVDYFGAKYIFPQFIFHTVGETLALLTEKKRAPFRGMLPIVLRHMLWPFINSCEFHYNPSISLKNQILEEPDYGRRESSSYGYELFIGDLPKDFKNSTYFYDAIKKEATMVKLQGFHEKPPLENLKRISSDQEFANYVSSQIQKTIKDMAPQSPDQPWREFEELLIRVVQSGAFTRCMTENLLGKESNQKKEMRKNSETVSSKPWRFLWGGLAESVMDTYYGFQTHPTQNQKIVGTQREVLVSMIRWVKNQPDSVRQEMDHPLYQTTISSPGHAFNIVPNLPSFKRAWSDPKDPLSHIEEDVIRPGIKIANRRIDQNLAHSLIDFVCLNGHFSLPYLPHDRERQELSTFSKGVFDELLLERAEDLSKDPLETVWKITSIARAKDPKIGKRNRYFEERLKRALQNKWKEFQGDASRLIDFARNRKDDLKLSETSKQEVLEIMTSVAREGLNMAQFCKKLIHVAERAYQRQNGIRRNDYKKLLQPKLSSYLFSKLSSDEKKVLIESSIATCDTNWKDGIDPLYFCFLVNPATGDLELARINYRMEEITFLYQKDWFQKPCPEGSGCWAFPKNKIHIGSETEFRIQKDLWIDAEAALDANISILQT